MLNCSALHLNSDVDERQNNKISFGSVSKLLLDVTNKVFYCFFVLMKIFFAFSLFQK